MTARCRQLKWSIFWGRCEMGASLIFDYDGTIHDTLRIYEPALRRAFKWLEEEHGVRVPHTSRQRIASWLGMNRREMWDSFLPGLPVELREEAGGLVSGNPAGSGGAERQGMPPGGSEQLPGLIRKGPLGNIRHGPVVRGLL